MIQEIHQRELLSHLEYLEENRLYVHNVLEMALTMGDFQKNINGQCSPQRILKEAQERIENLIAFDSSALYLVDQDSPEFVLTTYKSVESRQHIEENVNFLVNKGFFGWAVRERRGVLIESDDISKQFLLHVIATHSRVRGMFVGIMKRKTQRIPEAFRALLSIILLNTANALESLELCGVMRKLNVFLEQKVQQKTEALKQSVDELEREGSKRKKVEAELSEKEHSYQTLAQNLPGIIYRLLIRDNHRMIFFNDMLEPMTGYRAEDLEKKGARLIDAFILEKDKDITREAMTRAVREGTPFNVEYWLRHKDGSLRYFSERGRPVYDSDGNPLYIDGLIFDITERQKAAEEKEKLEVQLQRARKMEAIGILAGGVAHDLNNVLSGIVSYPDLLLMELSEDNPLRKPILSIQESGKKAAVIVQDLLTLARGGVAVPEVVNLNSIISKYLESPEYKKMKSFHPRVIVETGLANNLLNISGSPAHLSATVMNLVSNAAEAMPLGGKLIITTENRYIDRPMAGYDNIKEGDYVVFTISDRGEGMSKEDMERIFEPFYTKKKMGRSGTGLGMSVVWGVVKDHNGYIDLKSTLGKGTVFTLYFPGTREKAAEVQHDLQAEDYMGKGESILVVDDVKEQREIASSILSRLGYRVSVVSSGEKAIEYLEDNSVDLLVLDMIMDPGMDGLDTYKQILERYPNQKAIIASGFSETERVREVRRLGAGPYVRKPYTIEVMGRAVKKALAGQNPI